MLLHKERYGNPLSGYGSTTQLSNWEADTLSLRNALAQGALRQSTQWLWIDHSTFQLGGGHFITELMSRKARFEC